MIKSFQSRDVCEKEKMAGSVNVYSRDNVNAVCFCGEIV